MNEIAFLETMINTLKFDSKFKDKKEKLLPILRRCEINPIPQWAYVQHSGRSGQRYENVEIRVPVPLLDEANRKLSEVKVKNEQYNKAIRAAQDAFNEQRWQDAYSKSESALELRPDSSEAKRIRTESQRKIKLV